MATTTNLLSWKAFEQLPDDGMHHELIEGEHQVLPPPKSGHNVIASRVADALRPLADQKLGRVLIEAGYKLSDEPATWIQPDVSFLLADRVAATAPNGYFLNAPELAVEIVSPSETARDLAKKNKLLVAGGARTVWVIYPESHEVQVHSPDGTSLTRCIDESLSLSQLQPGLEILVSKFFED
jgi:Uma2 family endonuclease